MADALDRIEKILTSEYTVQNYVQFVQEIFDSLKLIAPDKFRKEFTNFSSHIVGSTHVGSYADPDGKKMIVAAVELKRATYVESSRSTQRSYAKKLIENAGADAALIAFYTAGEEKWRLSYVRLDYEMKFENGKFQTTENMTPAKRYSFLVGRGEPCHTAVDRFKRLLEDKNFHPTLDELEEAFSVEAVTKQFYQLYCDKFMQLLIYLEDNPDFALEAMLHNFKAEQFAKKLMGQIVFLYFLQKKGWLGVNAWPDSLSEKEYKDAFYARGAKSRELIPMVYRPAGDGTYRISSSSLESLSSDDQAVLAQCVKGKPWGTGPHDFMRKLFEYAQKKNLNYFDDCLEPLFYAALNVNRGDQGYYDPTLHCRIPFLSGGLFEPIAGYDWKHNEFAIPNEVFSNRQNNNPRTGDGILDIFDRYNFTMAEDEPLEREVAIDPEMLGKVFENLLEVKKRKDTGAFYTPREIVHYMCQESLINYLTTTLKVSEDAIRDFILYGDFMKDEDTVKEKRQGNGGMFISEELYKLDAEGKVVVNRLQDMDKALADVRVADPAVGSGAFPLGMLNEIVRARQNISAYFTITMKPYDIRLMYSMDRSPYRLKYETIKNCIYAADIEPSAVDIAQLRLWLSLVIDDVINPDAQSPLDGHRNPLPLPNLECNILCGNSLIDEFEGIPLINQSELIGTAHDNQQIDIYQSGFEAVLPKLIDAQDRLFRCDDTQKKQSILEEIASYRDMIIMSQLQGKMDTETLERYEESKKAAAKPYVLWQLDFARVFRDKGGFDIVIGNPPYVSAATQMIEESLLKNRNIIINSKRFATLYSKWDLYIPFLELGTQLLHLYGNMTMIVPYPLTNQIYAKKLRELFTTTYNMTEIVDLKEVKVFEATVQNCIPFVTKCNSIGNTIISRMENRQIKQVFVQPHSKMIQDEKTQVWNLTEEERGTDKHSAMRVLGDYCYISKGMVLNADEKTAKGVFKKADLISIIQDDIHSKKYIEGKDIESFKIKRIRFLEWGTARSPYQLSRPTFEELYTSKKLLFNCLGELKVAIDLKGDIYCEQAIRMAVLWKDLAGIENKSISSVIKKYATYTRAELESISQTVDLRYLLGIVASSYGKSLLADIRGGDYHIVPEHIRSIPIPEVDNLTQKNIVDIVDKIILLKSEDKEVPEKLFEDLDGLVYEIYGVKK